MENKMKLTDMGTTGLESYVVDGSHKGHGLRLAQAMKIIKARGGEKASGKFYLLCLYGSK